MRIELDCRQMTDRQAVHTYLQQMLSLPDYYGKNLDALLDLLTEQETEMVLVLACWQQLDELLGSYGVALLDTLREASEENPKLEVVLTDSI